MSDTKLIVKSQRSISGLRETLFETLDELRAGTTDALKAKAVVGIAQTILNTVHTQVRVEGFKARTDSLEQLPDVPLPGPSRRRNAAKEKLS